MGGFDDDNVHGGQGDDAAFGGFDSGHVNGGPGDDYVNGDVPAPTVDESQHSEKCVGGPGANEFENCERTAAKQG